MRTKAILAALAALLVAAALVARAQVASTSGSPTFDRAHSDFDSRSVSKFADFPAYSLGDSFERLPLTAITRRVDKPYPGEPGADYISFLYGTCTTSDETGCPAPLEVQVWPACKRSLADYRLDPAGNPLPHVRSERRGVPAASFEDGTRLELYTGRVTIVVFGLDAAQVSRAATALRGVNVAASAGAPLPRPVAGALEGKLACGAS